MSTRIYRDVPMTDPEAAQMAAGYLQSQWGYSGYKLGFAGFWTDSTGQRTWHVWQCKASDGSRFLIRTDRYSNAGTFEHTLEAEVAELLGVEVSP